jgi:hypothetical protein
MPQPALHPMPDNRATDSAAHNESHFGTGQRPRQRHNIGRTIASQMHDNTAARCPATPLHRCREIGTAGQSSGSGQQRQIPRSVRWSGRQFSTTFAAPGSDDRSPSPCTHAQPEPVGSRATAVVRLKRALALAHGCRSPRCWCSVLECRVAVRRGLQKHENARRWAGDKVSLGGQHR